MKKLFHWLLYVMIYILGISSLISINLYINHLFYQYTGKTLWLINLLEAFIWLLIGVSFISILNRMYQKTTSDTLLSNWETRPTLLALGYGLLLFGSTIVYQYLYQLNGQPNHTPTNQQILMYVMKQIPLQLILHAGILAPFIEELLFRGILRQIIWAKLRSPYCFTLASGCLFAILHAMPNSWDFIMYAVMGGILTLCYLHTRQLKYSILAHVINNTIALIIMWYEVK